MRAITHTTHGGPGNIEIVDLGVPEPGPGQVRIKVQAAAVHPADVAAVTGIFAAIAPADGRRYRLGWDLAGTIDALGPDTSGFAVGEPVIGLADWLDDFNGTQAEYAVLDARAVATSPSQVNLAAAATLPLNGLTAIQALDLLALPAGATLLVTGAAGAVGGFAVELAAARGLRVIAVAGETDEQLVRDLGAIEFVPRSADVAETVRTLVPGGVDGALDTALIGGAVLNAVRDDGAFVALIAPAAPAPERGIRVTAVHVRSNGEQLASLAALVDRGELTLRAGETYPLSDAASAYERQAKGGLRGVLVLVP